MFCTEESCVRFFRERGEGNYEPGWIHSSNQLHIFIINIMGKVHVDCCKKRKGVNRPANKSRQGNFEKPIRKQVSKAMTRERERERDENDNEEKRTVERNPNKRTRED